MNAFRIRRGGTTSEVRAGTDAEACESSGTTDRTARRCSEGIIVGHVLTSEKLQLARELRRNMTPAERTLWQALRGGQPGVRFRRQQVIDGFIVDFYCNTARLIIEVDSGIHEDQQGHDIARDELLASRGLHIVRFTNDDVTRDLAGILHRSGQPPEHSVPAFTWAHEVAHLLPLSAPEMMSAQPIFAPRSGLGGEVSPTRFSNHVW
jgi:very-short-patch-repair endonuclease